jgi:hypothetical protein
MRMQAEAQAYKLTEKAEHNVFTAWSIATAGQVASIQPTDQAGSA